VNDGRKRYPRVLATLSIAALGAGMLVASPSSATPDVGDVQTRVDRLYRQAEQASERYDHARMQMHRADRRLEQLRSEVHQERAKVAQVRRLVAASVVAQYQGQALTSTSQVLLSRDPDTFLSQLSTISQFNDQQTQLMASYAVHARQLDTRRADAARELAGIERTKRQLGAEKAQIDEKAARAKKLLATLKQQAAQRAAERASRSADRAAATAPAAAPSSSTGTGTAPAVPASGRAAAAVHYALAQVGKAYVYGAAGPSAFDCSGLTMMAWAQAGVRLPHSSSAQMGYGTPVSQSQLQPGDLVFYYSPVSHVGMYIGNGQIVNAENPSVGVKITGVNSMPYAGAVRPG
jgi:cell wall-associated NlpC family hydrolase